ncbi:phenylacetate--CoA ligase family protein [Aquisphaera insulae]|uniref:phenylacetate--CoA ligase family protein n=1 Tax=Aquisphaera insulae TaxID=2712864 RepID=UPI0013EA4B64|nr:phenylacetate--CoA ligase family protein [Aquisphaera insulae]
MDFYAPVARAFIGPLWAAWERSPYLRHFRELKDREYEAAPVAQKKQWDVLRGMIRHAFDEVPYYQSVWTGAGIDPERIQDWNDFESIPVLTKADIRAHGPELIARGYDRRDLRRKATSGSTGVSLEVWVDEPSMQFKRACTLLADERSGWRFGEPVAMIWGNPEYLKRGWRGRLRNTLLERARYLDTLKMDEETMARFAAELTRRPPSLIFGHAHSVYLFAEFVHSRGLGPIRPRGVITSAMILHDWQRQAIEGTFACKVTNRYGCEEVSLIASECERHEGLHVNGDGVYVELIRDGRPVGPGEPGSVVVTDLTNRAMPIIRYQVGDVASWADHPCSCGRGMPLLERVEGREADFVSTIHGELISGISLTENFAMLVPGIAQLQIIQEEFDRFTFRIVKGDDFGPESLSRIAELVAQRFGQESKFDCEFVGMIPQEPSGKYRFCISKLPNAFSDHKISVVSIQ